MSPLIKTFSDWASIGTDIKINELRDYLETLQKQLKIMTDGYEKQVNDQAKQIEDELARNEFYEWSSEDYWNYKETFPRILFNSFLVSAYSLLESEIYSIARRLGQKQEQLFKVDDFGSRNYLNTASSYINKLTNINAQDFTSWPLVEDGRTLRNNIVHSNGVLSRIHEIEVANKYALVKETDISISSGRPIRHLAITFDYNKSFISTLKKFFGELYEGMKAGDHL